MPRRLKIVAPEMGGDLELYLIYSYNGVWESEWVDLQADPGVDLPVVSKEVMDHALIGWTRPLVQALGPAPDGKLRLLPVAARRCANEATCSLFDNKRCGLLLSKMPWCYEPDGLKDKRLAADVVKLWREQVYVVVVNEDSEPL